MIEIVDVPKGPYLEDYAAYAFLSPSVQALIRDARVASGRLASRTVWMVSSTKEGGGVAEGLPRLVSLLRQLGVATEWAVIGSGRPEFFALTKRVHNLLHGSGDPALDGDDRALFDKVGGDLAAELRPHLRPNDVLVIHDPQPLALGDVLKRDVALPLVWRCHVRLEERNAAADAAWDFLEPHARHADRAVFSLPDYVPPFLTGRAAVLPPSIDPLSHKNRELDTHKLTGILIDAALAPETHPALTPAIRGPGGAAAGRRQLRTRHRARGSGPPVPAGDHPGVAVGPAQGLPAAPRRLRADETGHHGADPWVHRRRPPAPPPRSGAPGPGRPRPPAASRTTRRPPACWRRSPVPGRRWSRRGSATSPSCDCRCGRVLRDPTDAAEVARTIAAMLVDDHGRDRWGRNARHRVTRETLIFTELHRWLDLLAGIGDGGRG